MRILAVLPDETRRGCDAALSDGHTVTAGADATAAAAAIRSRGFDAVVLDPELMTQVDFELFVSAVSDAATPVIVYTALSSVSAHRIVQLAERSTVELVVRGLEDLPVITHKLASLVRPSIPARLLSRAASRLRQLPERLKVAAVGLFGNGPQPRWVDGLATATGIGRRSIDRWMYRAGINGAATLLDTARMARVWEPLVEEKRPVAEIAEQCGYGRVRLLVAHCRRLIDATPEQLGRTVSRSRFVERLAGRLLTR